MPPPNHLKDWAWHPDAITREAIKRGNTKVLTRRRHVRDDLIDFSVDSSHAKKSKARLKREGRERDEVRSYLLRVTPRQLKLVTKKGTDMTWATIVLMRMTQTRALSRHENVEAARTAGKQLPKEMRDYVIVEVGYDMRPFGNHDLDALMDQFGDPRKGLVKEVKSKLVLHYLELFDASRHGADGTLLKPYDPAPLEEKMETNTATGSNGATRKKAAPATKAKGKGKGKTAAPVAAKKKAAAKEGAVPRIERPAFVIKEALQAGKTVDQILAITKKQFAGQEQINGTYVKWYQRKLAKDGDLTPAGKKVLAAQG